MEENYELIVENLLNNFAQWYKDEDEFKSGEMSKNLYPYKNLFSPIQINNVKIKNRIVMAPMGNISMCEETGRPSIKMIQYFIERAKGGAGLITSGLIPISQNIDPSVLEKGDKSCFPRIDSSRTVLSGWRDLVEGVHAHGSKFFIQLTPGLGRVGSPECLVNKGKLPVSASWNPDFYLPAVKCRPLFDRQCNKIIKNLGKAASDSKAMHIDGVYLHGHEGYLLEQMTNPAFNRRKVGKFSNWQTFGLELVKEIRNKCGSKYPIMYRIDLSLVLNYTYGNKMNDVKVLKKFKNERTIEMTLDYMKNLVKAGVDIFDVDLGCYDNWWLPHPPGPMPPGCFLLISNIVKDYFNKNNIKANTGLNVPIVAVGKLGYPDLCEKALSEEKCDMVMLGRPLLADPYWPQKAYMGKVDEIRPCIGDQEGCFNEFVEGGHPQCAVNPCTGFEDVFCINKMPLSSNPKKVAVIGAGPAGVMCACTAAKKGHSVTLFEKEDKIGGMLLKGGVPKIKFDVKNYIKYLQKQIEIMQGKNNLQLNLGNEVKAEDLKEAGFDVIICALGTKQIKLNIPGIDKSNVVYAVDLLKNPSIAENAKKVVVIGGGVVGCETAYFLRSEMNKEVKIVEMLPQFMKGVFTANRGFLIHYLEKMHVDLINLARVKSIDENKVTIIRNVSKTVPDPYVTWTPILPDNIKNPFEKKIKVEEKEFIIEADLVVLAAGVRPNDDLYYKCKEIMASKEVYNIGDSSFPGRVFEAVKSGYRVGRNL
ncbi:FAD-dependent oxidoreductase [Haloimpatiens sp. FM7315]|uniref:FAD-dependent oxidoreductase n=1 Tax=Haloimpatiens sp. FM7315 TaxID=3298609 RepID=UPI0035A32FB5